MHALALKKAIIKVIVPKLGPFPPREAQVGAAWECSVSIQYFAEQPGLCFMSCVLDFVFAWKPLSCSGSPLFFYLFYRNRFFGFTPALPSSAPVPSVGRLLPAVPSLFCAQIPLCSTTFTRGHHMKSFQALVLNQP